MPLDLTPKRTQDRVDELSSFLEKFARTEHIPLKLRTRAWMLAQHLLGSKVNSRQKVCERSKILEKLGRETATTPIVHHEFHRREAADTMAGITYDHMQIVPLPGTFAYEQWLNQLKQANIQSKERKIYNKSGEEQPTTLEILLDWEKNFLGGNLRLNNGLRRVRIVVAHILSSIPNEKIIYVE